MILKGAVVKESLTTEIEIFLKALKESQNSIEGEPPWEATIDGLPMVWDCRGDAIIKMTLDGKPYFVPFVAEMIAAAVNYCTLLVKKETGGTSK